jgi:hypothetical protein
MVVASAGGVEAKLKGPGAVQAGQAFETRYEVSHASEVYAQDVTFTYDADHLEYTSASTTADGVQIIQQSKKPGSIRFIMASLNTEDAARSGDKLVLTWKTKSANKQSNTVITVKEATIANGDGEETRVEGVTYKVKIKNKEKGSNH